MPGPKRKPAELEAKQGNPGRRKNRPPLPDPPAIPVDDSPVKAPAWLSATHRKVFDNVAPILRRNRLLQAPDVIAFARYCQWLGRYIELERKSRRSPVVKTTKSKHVNMDRLDKAFQALAVIDKQLIAYEDRFGMSPRERFALMARLAGDTPRRESAVPPPAPTVEEPAPAVAAVGKSPVGFLKTPAAKMH